MFVDLHWDAMLTLVELYGDSNRLIDRMLVMQAYRDRLKVLSAKRVASP